MPALLPGLLALVLGRIPHGPAPVAALTTADLRHHEVLRIDRDFGMAKWELALDGWVPHEGDDAIAELRLWWVNVEEDGRRKPFSAHLRRYIDFGYERGADGTLAVRLAGDRKAYSFTVVREGTAAPTVHATVTLADGTQVPRCRCQRGRLIARRILGLPIGIAALQVRCTDADGLEHEGTVPYGELASGREYTPE